jgi:hypothetical protein
VGFDVLTTCQPSTVWCSRERLPAAAAQPAKVRQSCSATDLFYLFYNIITMYNAMARACRKRRLKCAPSAWGYSSVTLSLGITDMEA